MIVKDKSRLTTRCEPTNIKDGEEIAVRLLHELRTSEESGIGIFFLIKDSSSLELSYVSLQE